jgi:hypothetical protein
MFHDGCYIYLYHDSQALEDLLEDAVLHIVSQEVEEEEIGGRKFPVLYQQT